MNSFNHYAIGAVGEWMWRVMVGIQPDEAAPGYKHFTLQPVPPGPELRQRIGLDWVDATYHSIRGPIQVAWRIEGGLFKLSVQVPCNTSATVILPGSPFESHQVGSGRWEFECKV
jgi:alpha-L-rhamnosidase